MNINEKMRSINYKTLGYLVLFSIAILILLWFFQVIFLKYAYDSYQTRNMENFARKVRNENIADLNATIEDIAFNNNICAEIILDNGMSMGINTRISGCLLSNNNKVIIQYKNQLIESGLDMDYIKLRNPENDSKAILYLVRIENGYVFINSPLEDINSTTKILRSQLIYITFIGIILACLIAYFLAKKITRPITNITKQARKIGKDGGTLRYEKTGVSEIDELVVTLNQAQEEIETTENLRRDLMANVGHDLKTPLTMIKAYAEMVKDFSYKDKTKRDEHLDIIVKETDRLNILVNDIVSLSKMQADADKLDVTKFDLSFEIREIVKRYDIIKETEDYNFVVNIPKKMIVCADKNKINQVIYNLINNAINYTGSDKKVIIRAKELGGEYLVEIIDTGKGIKEHELDIIWDKYYKSEKNHQRNVVGTGIGLSIVKQILTKHNFDFGVKSKLKKGSTFFFKIKKCKM